MEGNGLWVDMWMRRKCQAPSPSAGTAQVRQGACEGVRSLQGCSAWGSSVRVCELAALHSVEQPGGSRLEKRQQTAALPLRSFSYTRNKRALTFLLYCLWALCCGGGNKTGLTFAILSQQVNSHCSQ